MNEIELLQEAFFNLTSVWLCLIVLMLLDDYVADERETHQFQYFMLVEPTNIQLPERKPDGNILTKDGIPVLKASLVECHRTRWITKEEAKLLDRSRCTYGTVCNAEGMPVFTTITLKEKP